MGQCGSTLRKPCLSDSDIRYDSKIPKDILAQEPRWEKFQGYFKVELFNFNAGNGTMMQPGPFTASMPNTRNKPFLRSNITAWYNHTFDGSRLYIHRHYLKSPAPASFCDIPSFPEGGANHTQHGICGVNGYSEVAGNMVALTHENDASLEVLSSYGGYGGSFGARPITKMFVTDENTFDGTSQIPNIWSSTTSFVFYDNNSASLSAIHTMIMMREVASTAVGKLARVTEEEYINGLNEDYDNFNVPAMNRAVVPLESNEAMPGTYPNETEWCGGIIDDAGCTVSPYVEPDPQFTGGAIAMFVVIGVLGFSIIAYSIHKYILGKQKKRIQLHMVRGIAQNITIASSAGQMDGEALLKEFEHMDKDKGGTISKEEMKDWMADGKLGEISDKDFDALWVAMDTDSSGEVDFVEFASYLSGCGEAFDEVFQERKNMTREELVKRMSQRLSMKHVTKKDLESLKELRKNAATEFDEEENNST